MARRSFVSGLKSTVRWLRDHDIPVAVVADLLTLSSEHVRKLDYDARRMFALHEKLPARLVEGGALETVPGPELRSFLGIRSDSDGTGLSVQGVKAVRALEDAAEEVAGRFWAEIREPAYISRLKRLKERVGYPSHPRRVKLLARIYGLLSEVHLHTGRPALALADGLRAYHLYRVAHADSLDPLDLRLVAHTARLVAQMFLSGGEPDFALHFLSLHRSAVLRVGDSVRPEYHHQLGTIAFRANTTEADERARLELQMAMRKLAAVDDYGRGRALHEIRDIGERHMNLLRPFDWESSLGLLHDQLSAYPPGDVHHGLNVAATAACGLVIGDAKIESTAMDLLIRHADFAGGYPQLETAFRLLQLTPKLPSAIRAAWTRFALYENTAKDF